MGGNRGRSSGSEGRTARGRRNRRRGSVQQEEGRADRGGGGAVVGKQRERERPARCRPRVQPIGRSRVIQSKKRSLQLVAMTPLALACMAMSAPAADRANLHQQDVSSINSPSANATVALGVQLGRATGRGRVGQDG